MNAYDFPCQKCGAKPGEKCKDYRGQNCGPHRSRGKETPKKGRKQRLPAPRPAADLYDLIDQANRRNGKREVLTGRSDSVYTTRHHHHLWAAQDVYPALPTSPRFTLGRPVGSDKVRVARQGIPWRAVFLVR